MNFKQQARELEDFIKENFEKNNPIALLPNGNLAYKEFIIRKNRQDKWELVRVKGNILDTFNLKSCAVLGAKFYYTNNFSRYNEIKMLDSFYFKHQIDSDIYKIKYDKTKDVGLKDMFMARFCESKRHANYARKEITSKFKALF